VNARYSLSVNLVSVKTLFFEKTLTLTQMLILSSICTYIEEAIALSLGVSICLDMVLIESFDLSRLGFDQEF
jgi:hypothetical protein